MIKKLLDFIINRKKGSIILSILLVSFFALLFIGIPDTAMAAESILTSVVNALEIIIASLFRTTFYFADEAANLLGVAMNPDNFLAKGIITSNPLYYKSWASVRDIANMGIVLGFVLVGVATTLRLQTYSAQKLLPKLIIVAILINFTPLFCGLVIDSSNIIAKSFTGAKGVALKEAIETKNTQLNSSAAALTSKKLGSVYGGVNGDPSGSGGLVDWLSINLILPILVNHGWNPDPIYQQTMDTLSIKDASSLVTKYLAESFVAAGYFIFSGIIFLILAGLLMARYAMLILLFIASPLAFFCIIFPFSKKWFDVWLSNFLKWSFIGVTTLFCIMLANEIFLTKTSLANMDIFITCIILYVGYKLAMTSSAIGASVVTGAMKTIADKTIGAGVGAAAGLVTGGPGGAVVGAAKGFMSGGQGATKSAATQVATQIAGSAAASGLLERLNLVKPGTASTAKAKEVNKNAELMKEMSDNEINGVAERANPNTATGQKIIAGAMKQLASRGSIDTVDPTKLPGFIAIATKRGVDRDMFTKASPELATTSTETLAKAEQIQFAKAKAGGMTDAAAKIHAEITAPVEVVRQAVQAQSPESLAKNITTKSLENPDVMIHITSKQAHALAKAPQDKIDSAKLTTTMGTSQNTAFQNKITTLHNEFGAAKTAGNAALQDKIQKQIEDQMDKFDTIDQL